MNKNLIIGVLFILMLIASVWGQKEAGKNKALAQEKDTLLEQLQAESTAVSDLNTLQTEVAEQERAQRQMTSRLEKTIGELNDMRQENNTLKVQIAEQDAELNDLKAVKEKKMDVHHKQMKTLRKQLKKQQAVIEENTQRLASAVKEAEQGQQQLKELENTRAKLEEAKGKIRQIQEEQTHTAKETEYLRAQVIGYEKIVEERDTTLAESIGELEDCKINTKVLISKITDQDNAQHSMQEKMHLMVQNLAEQRSDTTGNTQTDPTQAEQQ